MMASGRLSAVARHVWGALVRLLVVAGLAAALPLSASTADLPVAPEKPGAARMERGKKPIKHPRAHEQSRKKSGSGERPFGGPTPVY
jgi:hypothetical protein